MIGQREMSLPGATLASVLRHAVGAVSSVGRAADSRSAGPEFGSLKNHTLIQSTVDISTGSRKWRAATIRVDPGWPPLMLAGHRSTLDRDFRSGAPPRGERAMSPEFTAIIVVGLSNVAALVFL